MNPEIEKLVYAALAALSQNKTFPADIAYAKRCLKDAVTLAAEERMQDEIKDSLAKEMHTVEARRWQ